jgi:hypothetical protein
MRSLVLDELRQDEVAEADLYIKQRLKSAALTGLYLMILPEELLNEEQKALAVTEGPYSMSVEVGKSHIRFELLVRADDLANKGSRHADAVQVTHVYSFVDRMAHELGLVTCL